ncbi:hypothetical protein BaRGS_00002965 [Batillaria attramentaria]|uniref:CDT1 Geminin-binding domain-containing protein n=1 Tax=Batillaria attramentaria TaxID=370345 RepID=A0ABD0M1M6_9CAEN
MAQAHVNFFFAAKKRSQNPQASKRRKLDLSVSDAKLVTVSSSELNAGSTEKALVGQEKSAAVAQASKQMKKQQTRSIRSTRLRTASRKKSDTQAAGKSQLKIHEAFSQASGSSSDSDSRGDGKTEEITSCWDEHDGPQTPRKKIRSLESLELPESTEVRPSRRKLAVKKRITDAVTPQSNQDDIKLQNQKLASSARKNLSLTLTDEKLDTEKEQVVSKPTEGSKLTSDHGSGPAPQKGVPLPSSAELQKELAPAVHIPHSPLPQTPELVRKSPMKKAKSVTSPHLKATMEKCKELTEGETGSPSQSEGKMPSKKEKILAPDVIRERLAKCGKLETLKSKLAEMNSTLRAVRKIEADKKRVEELPEAEHASVSSVQVDTKSATKKDKTEAKPTPAYERYEYLAKEGTPTLALPGKFQRLLTMFQGSDTVVSMLYNRQETITFSKLQTAVQSMTRKNFEQGTLGQIKKVYPTAYTLRQEKNLPCFGNKTSGYQLTVEPNLVDCGADGAAVNENGRPTFTASALLKRRRIFHGSLLDIVKNHHTDFLSKLDPPVQVPASKLTRWHPRFPLDSVPDIEPSSLPAPPVQAVQTARQLLDNARGKLPNRVEAALEKVAIKAGEAKPDVQPATQASNKPVTSAHKGIPLSLLEKIRAKEAAKMQAALTRDPAEDRKTEMMGRLPAIIRSLRIHYVTEKKPTLPMATVVQKLADSYATCISHADVEAHLKLLQELAPKWIQVVQITRGKFVKIDKNADIAVLIDKITKLAKSGK